MMVWFSFTNQWIRKPKFNPIIYICSQIYEKKKRLLWFFFKLKIKKSLIFIFQTREKRKSNVSVDKKKGKTCEPLTEIGVMWPALKRVIWWCGPWCGLTQSALDILYVDWLGQPPFVLMCTTYMSNLPCHHLSCSMHHGPFLFSTPPTPIPQK